MQLTRETVARRLVAYLHHEISLAELVVWANTAVMEDDFEEAHYDTLRNMVAHLGLADVRAFELTWEDYASMLKRLGDDVREVL